MTKIKAGALALTIGLFVLVGCGPNDDGGGMDQKNSDGEGEVDSTRMPNFDSAAAALTIWEKRSGS